MDTDDLTDMAYKTLTVADSINHIITVEIGARSRDYRDEDSYLNGILKHIRSIRENAKNYREDWDIEGEISTSDLIKGTILIEKHILKTLAMPLDKRFLRPNNRLKLTAAQRKA